MSSSNPLQVKAFDHITLIVADLDATCNFYGNVLGMTLPKRPAFDFPGTWFEIKGVQIHATVASDLAGQAGWGDRDVKSISRGHHFAFEVDDVADAHAEVLRLGIQVGDGPKIRPDGAYQLYIYDPDGHLVELFSSPSNSDS
ncbi:MAG: catechol 2,3-dioxygenase-like lactoylglutathione lyase family enzyme [Mariniblastus sp.]|jgi:catechol 2,3-dioxygenase-like lactoylglutathione lyase family enzyme